MAVIPDNKVKKPSREDMLRRMTFYRTRSFVETDEANRVEASLFQFLGTISGLAFLILLNLPLETRYPSSIWVLPIGMASLLISTFIGILYLIREKKTFLDASSASSHLRYKYEGAYMAKEEYYEDKLREAEKETNISDHAEQDPNKGLLIAQITFTLLGLFSMFMAWIANFI